MSVVLRGRMCDTAILQSSACLEAASFGTARASDLVTEALSYVIVDAYQEPQQQSGSIKER